MRLSKRQLRNLLRYGEVRFGDDKSESEKFNKAATKAKIALEKAWRDYNNEVGNISHNKIIGHDNYWSILRLATDAWDKVNEAHKILTKIIQITK